MAVTGSALRFNRLRRRFGIGAPRLAIKAHVAWYWKLLTALVVLLLVFVLSIALFEAGKSFAGGRTDSSAKELLLLSARVVELDSALANLRSQLAVAESDLQIERETVRQLSRQFKSLELDNAALKEDLTFFEGLMPAPSGTDASIRIEHLRVEPVASSGEYRYRMLVVNGGRGEKKAFKGELQFLVKVMQKGRESIVSIPGDGDSGVKSPQYIFESRYFRRLEGGFALPGAPNVVGVEARVLQDGEVRAKQYVVL